MEITPTSHRFGGMTTIKLTDEVLCGKIEMMRFELSGSWHKHDTDEIALCVGGKGFVHFDTDDGMKTVKCEAGTVTRIEAGRSHYMEPKGGEMLFVILYAQPSESSPLAQAALALANAYIKRRDHRTYGLADLSKAEQERGIKNLNESQRLSEALEDAEQTYRRLT